MNFKTLKTYDIILASCSPRRKELLEKLKLPFSTIQSKFDETNLNETQKDPQKLVCELARLKGEFVLKNDIKNRKTIIISADTIVFDLETKTVFNKPKHYDDAFNMIHRLQNKTHCVYSGICVINVLNQKVLIRDHKTFVSVDALSKEQINEFLATNDYIGKAGAYGIQGAFAKHINKIDGCFYSVMGLPLNELYNMLIAL